MLETINVDIPKTIGLRVRGKLDDVSFKTTSKEMMEALDGGRCKIYLEVESVTGVTFEAVWDSIKLALRHLGEYLKKIERVAVVTNIEWVQMATKVENKLIPSIEEKSFTLEEKDLAKVWLTS